MTSKRVAAVAAVLAVMGMTGGVALAQADGAVYTACLTRSGTLTRVAVGALPKTRSQKVIRRAIRAVVTDSDPGDLSSLEDPASIEAIKAAV